MALNAVRSWLIAAKQTKYSEYIELIKQKQALKEKEATKKKENKKWIWGDDDENKNDEVKNDGQKQNENDAKQTDEAKIEQSDDANTKLDFDKDEKNEEIEGTVFDRIDSIIFCCFDIGNWHLYKEQTPKIFTSSNNKHSYLWNDQSKTNQKIRAKKATGFHRASNPILL